MGRPVHMDRPKSNRTSPHIQSANCRPTGLSRPNRARSSSRVSLGTKAPSPAYLSWTMSPGATRRRRKTRIATPSRVGMVTRRRARMNLRMGDSAVHKIGNGPPSPLWIEPGRGGGPLFRAPESWRSAVSRCAGSVLREPDVPQVLVQIVAGGDLPALELRPLGNDPLPPQAWPLVGHLGQDPALEGPDELLALCRIGGARLLQVQVVQPRVLVAAVVGRALVAGQVLEELQIRLVHEVAGEVLVGLVIAGPHVGGIGARLLDDLGHVQTHLPPLVNQVDAHGLVRHGHVAILEGELEPVGDAGLAQEAPGLRPGGLDVLSEPGQLGHGRCGPGWSRGWRARWEPRPRAVPLPPRTAGCARGAPP